MAFPYLNFLGIWTPSTKLSTWFARNNKNLVSTGNVNQVPFPNIVDISHHNIFMVTSSVCWLCHDVKQCMRLFWRCLEQQVPYFVHLYHVDSHHESLFALRAVDRTNNSTKCMYFQLNIWWRDLLCTCVWRVSQKRTCRSPHSYRALGMYLHFNDARMRPYIHRIAYHSVARSLPERIISPNNRRLLYIQYIYKSIRLNR